ncbi:MAG TPA: 6-hydroxymethylpterin diphosphokinase MptE-like protein [Stellaceae bacterium]|nr:6-hydroxymethylpterin diphosphokinase MptE-like protein [Stellaceae bacterium]
MRSREALVKLFPPLAKSSAHGESPAALVQRDGRAVDIRLGERLFYNGDAQEIAANQVKDYLEQPLRLVMDNFSEAGLLTPLCARMVTRLMNEMRGTKMRMPDEKSTYLVVFGLGLGHHLPELIRATRARWIIVVEPIREFIELSSDVVDWPEIAGLLDERQGAIHFVTDLDPGQMASSIAQCIRQHGESYIDGTWVFTHYPFWAFGEARQKLLADADNMFAQCGFFEDELKMTRNVAGNFASRPLWLLSGVKRPQRREIAVVVGAGPSLDGAIDKLKEIRDRIVLFSGGTALRPLLRNGIVPDFQCELENAPEVLEVLQEAAKHGDLSKITLIGSLSLDPRVSLLFGDRIFFFRENSSGTALFKGKFEPLRGAVPTCVNTALSAASFLGFTEFLLFGTDCGIRPGQAADHAEGTVYRDVWKDRPEIVRKYPMEVEGNFGGVAMTNWVLDYSRRILSIAINRFRLSVTNCSDGSLIPGTTPRVPEAIELEGETIDRERLFADLKKSMAAFQPGELLASFDLDLVRGKITAMYRELMEIVDQIDPDEPDFAGVHATLTAFQKSATEKYAELYLISEGTVLALARIAMYCGSRVADEGHRRRLNKIFIDTLRESFEEMQRTTEKLMEQVREYADRFSIADESVGRERARAS